MASSAASTSSATAPAQGTSAADQAKANVFVQSEAYQGTRIQGPDFNEPHSLQQLLDSYQRIGFQANGLARAIELIDKMVRSPSSLPRALKRPAADAPPPVAAQLALVRRAHQPRPAD